jgi:prepilin-type processing-associated H-X9-DG protein
MRGGPNEPSVNRGGDECGMVQLLPYLDQAPLYNSMPTQNAVPSSPWNNVSYWSTKIPLLYCASASTGGTWQAAPIQQKCYKFSVGTTTNNNYNGLTNGLFGFSYAGGHKSLADITDGSSNTVAMAETGLGVGNFGGNTSRSVIGQTVVGISTGIATNATLCLQTASAGQYLPANAISSWGQGTLWGFGHPGWSAVTTILPPNGPSCSTSGDNMSSGWGIWTANSNHTGGAQVLMADGAVRFISANINAGNYGAGSPASFGTWGALGTINNGDIPGDF